MHDQKQEDPGTGSQPPAEEQKPVDQGDGATGDPGDEQPAPEPVAAE